MTRGKLRRSEDVKTTLLPDGYVILVKSGVNEGLTLSPTAALLWEFADGEHTLDEIETRIRELVPGAPGDDFKLELESLAKQLVEQDFLFRND